MKTSPREKGWVEIRCSLPLVWADPVAEWLIANKASGVLFDEEEGAPPERVTLTTALPAEADVESLCQELRELGAGLAERSGLAEALSVEASPIPPERLKAMSAPSFSTVELAPGLWVVPELEEGKCAGEVTGEVPPGAETMRLVPALAFGTGRHPSTRLAARLAAGWFEGAGAAPRVLDAGCGSGVLAVASALWGAALVVGVERDRMALENALRNAELNGVASRVALVAADLAALAPRPWADLVLANLDRDLFLSLAPKLAGWLADRGALVASGILEEQEGPVLEALQGAGLAAVERAEEAGWVALLLKRT